MDGVKKYSSNDLFDDSLDDSTRRLLYNGCDTAITMDLFKHHMRVSPLYEKVLEYVSEVLKRRHFFETKILDVSNIIDKLKSSQSGITKVRKELTDCGILKKDEPLPRWKFNKLHKDAKSPEDKKLIELIMNDFKIQEDIDVLQTMCLGKPFRLVPDLYEMQFKLRLDGTFFHPIPFKETLEVLKRLETFQNMEISRLENPVKNVISMITGVDYSKFSGNVFDDWVMNVGPIVSSRTSDLTVAETKAAFAVMMDECPEIESLKMDIFTQAYEDGEITNPVTKQTFRVSKQLHKTDVENKIFQLLIDNTLLNGYLDKALESDEFILIHRNDMCYFT